MSVLDQIRKLLEACTYEEQVSILDYLQARTPQHPLEREWGVGGEVILSAISRSSDLTKRGVRGIIAEAIFERSVLASLKGWESVSFVDDRPYDFMIRQSQPGHKELRIQLKLQRMKKQQPMHAQEANRHYPKDMYVVEVQKTRGGIDLQTNEDTRPYRFGEFDILAVNMHPSTRDWNRFFFTVSDWLIPRHANPGLIEIFQPVSPTSNDVWTDALETCIEWVLAGGKKRILDIEPELLMRRPKRPKS
ncbi:MAG TPA: hypothetical protein VN517_17300 [Terriglobales bacterium]|nr:hypothetical protein [Terriglobales bacterium]